MDSNVLQLEVTNRWHNVAFDDAVVSLQRTLLDMPIGGVSQEPTAKPIGDEHPLWARGKASVALDEQVIQFGLGCFSVPFERDGTTVALSAQRVASVVDTDEPTAGTEFR